MELTIKEMILFLKVKEKINRKRSHFRTFLGGKGYEERPYFTCPCCLKVCKSYLVKEMNHIKLYGISVEERKSLRLNYGVKTNLFS